MESHVPRKLDTKMTEATNALHRHQIASTQTGIAKGVVGRDARAQQRGGLYGTELIGNGSEATRFSDHYFRISSVCGYSRHHWVLAIHHVSAPALFTHPVFSGNETDTNPLTDFPSGYSAAKGFDAANYFVPRNARQCQPLVGARNRGGIRVANSTRFHSKPNLTRSRLRDWPFH
jgi:hypothetical protein